MTRMGRRRAGPPPDPGPPGASILIFDPFCMILFTAIGR